MPAERISSTFFDGKVLFAHFNLGHQLFGVVNIGKKKIHSCRQGRRAHIGNVNGQKEKGYN